MKHWRCLTFSVLCYLTFTVLTFLESEHLNRNIHLRAPTEVRFLQHAVGCAAVFSLFMICIYGVLHYRREVRRERGLCPACAYPVGTSEVCTECGKAVQTSRRSREGGNLVCEK
jgi:hypothetical protein